VVAERGDELAPSSLERFPDGELCPNVGDLRGEDVYVIQSTGPPVSENLTELLLLLDACRRSGARRITAVVPYFGYARQDRRSRAGEAVGARVATDVIAAAGADRLVVIDPHTPDLEAMSSIPLETLTAVPAVAHAVGFLAGATQVVVAPDLGAAKLAERFAALLGLPVAIVRKVRTSGSLVHAEELVGEVARRNTLIVDDMISTGATIEAAAGLLLDSHAEPHPVVVTIHGLFVGPAMERLDRLQPAALLTTDTVIHAPGSALHFCSVAHLLAEAIDRLHREVPLEGLGLFA
jgi:ribose-phosphate pyrophosphokinase